jgi:uncharacterized damage-inducible protein DinB
MDPRVAPLLAQFELNGRLLLNCLDGLDESRLRRHPIAELNSAAFLVAHLVDTRHYLLGLLERPAANPVAEYVSDATSMADVRELPDRDELTRAWREVAELVRDALAGTNETTLAKRTQHLPGSDGTVLGALAFLLQHESYHIGQLAYIRRMFDLPAMKYT